MNQSLNVRKATVIEVIPQAPIGVRPQTQPNSLPKTTPSAGSFHTLRAQAASLSTELNSIRLFFHEQACFRTLKSAFANVHTLSFSGKNPDD